MRHEIQVLSRCLGFFALQLLYVAPFVAQSASNSADIKHYGYSSTDKLLECIQRVYGKPVARFPYIRRLPDLPCPATREGIDHLLRDKTLPILLNAPKGAPSGIRLFETADWIYLIPSLFMDTKAGEPYYGFRQDWKSISVKTKVEIGEDVSEAEGKILRDMKSRAPDILRLARIIPLDPMAEPGTDHAVEVDVRLRFYTAKLSPKAPDSVITLIDQWPYVSVGRLAYGEIRDGRYQMLWDSPLLNGKGELYFEDVNGDGWKEIVWRSATCGAQNCIPQQIVVFDKDGTEITRQQDCRTGSIGFDAIDGVCAIEGESIQVAVVSAPPTSSNEEEERAPKDILVTSWYGEGRDAIFTLESGLYVLNKLDASQYSERLAAQRKVEGIKMAASLNEEGMQLMKEDRFQEAAYRFQSAYYANDSALYENNYGFALYKLEQYESSIWWFKHVLKLEPKRAIAYLNLGDGLVKLNRASEAREAYQKYLELAPDSNAALSVKKKLDALPSSP